MNRGKAMKLKFYDVDEKYVEILKKAEIKKRGSSKIPNIIYEERNKFVCGIVMNIDGMNYFAPVSSQTKYTDDSLLINDKGKNISSIRFAFMFPIPKKFIKLKTLNLKISTYLINLNVFLWEKN